MAQCSGCGKRIRKDQGTFIAGGLYCGECARLKQTSMSFTFGDFVPAIIVLLVAFFVAYVFFKALGVF